MGPNLWSMPENEMKKFSMEGNCMVLWVYHAPKENSIIYLFGLLGCSHFFLFLFSFFIVSTNSFFFLITLSPLPLLCVCACVCVSLSLLSTPFSVLSVNSVSMVPRGISKDAMIDDYNLILVTSGILIEVNPKPIFSWLLLVKTSWNEDVREGVLSMRKQRMRTG